VGPVLFVPALLAVLGLGIWLVLDSGEWGFGQTWVWLALALFAAAFVVATIFQGRAALGAQRAVTAGDQIEATRQLRRWAWGLGLIIALLGSTPWDMVIKPGFGASPTPRGDHRHVRALRHGMPAKHPRLRSPVTFARSVLSYRVNAAIALEQSRSERRAQCSTYCWSIGATLRRPVLTSGMRFRKTSRSR